MSLVGVHLSEQSRHISSILDFAVEKREVGESSSKQSVSRKIAGMIKRMASSFIIKKDRDKIGPAHLLDIGGRKQKQNVHRSRGGRIHEVHVHRSRNSCNNQGNDISLHTAFDALLGF